MDIRSDVHVDIREDAHEDAHEDARENGRYGQIVLLRITPISIGQCTAASRPCVMALF